MKYRTILWDVDRTLLDFDFSEKTAITQVFKTRCLTINDEIIELYKSINDSYWKRLELGEISKDYIIEHRFVDLFNALQIDISDMKALQDEYQQVLSDVYAYLDDSLTLCTTLKTKCNQYVVTNGIASTQHKKIALSGFKDCMHGVFVSEEIGFEKPQTGFFDFVKANIPDFDATTTLIIGDSLSSDILGGNLAGIATCYYNPKKKALKGDIKPTYEIEHLWDVLQVMDLIL
ncbi:MAG: YjjG family noncanonical pyrimidine nucleotidase [Lachnospiraceae bacterium]